VFGEIGKIHERTFMRRSLCLLDIELFDDVFIEYTRLYKKRAYSNTDIFTFIKKLPLEILLMFVGQ
jgi:hypothetical protein